MALKISSHSVSVIKEESLYPQTGIICANPWNKEKESLKEISFGGISEIRESAFEGCISLKKITFSDSLKRIGRNAFEGCMNLEEVVFPDTLKEMDIWLTRRAIKTSSSNPSSDVFIEALKKGYEMDLYYEGDYRDDHWD